jgi:hypothetical protein
VQEIVASKKAFSDKTISQYFLQIIKNGLKLQEIHPELSQKVPFVADVPIGLKLLQCNQLLLLRKQMEHIWSA